jgi:short-subunit dehydrogenase
VKDQHVVLTGASAGIGLALARALAARGCKLTLVARRRDKLEQLAASLSGPTRVVEHDLCVPSQAASFLPAAVEAFGPVDVLVNNAGLQVVGRTHLVDIEAAERSVATNLLSPLRLVHAVLPSMIERNTGTIVNISSMAALAPTPGMTWYNASKAGLAAASEALRGELRDTFVRILTVYPGIIPETDMARAALDKYHGEDNFMVRMQPTGTPDGLASVVLRAMERGTARVIWPRANALARHFPAATRWVMDRLSPLPEAARS